MNKSLLSFLALVGAFPCAYAQATRSAAASQAWVMNYVSNFVANSAAEVQAGTTATTVGDETVYTANAGTTNEMRLVVQAATDAALMATNCTETAVAAGVTNGLYFVWAGGANYINPVGTVTATPSNFTWRGVSSSPVNGLDRFAGWFDVKGVLIQAATSAAVTNAMTEVVQ